MPTAFLEQRGVVCVSGADARAFLQGLFTCDMNTVTPSTAAFGALLTPQGKIITDFFVTQEADDAFELDCPAERVTEFLRRLQAYKLRAKLDIKDLSDTHGVTARWGAGAIGIADPRHPELGLRRVGARAGQRVDTQARAAYNAHRIALGVPRGGVDFPYGDTFPHEANMDLLHGIDFRKGCYIGQEVVSRVEHRGLARRRVRRVAIEGATPSPGTPVQAGDVEIGVMGSSAAQAGLALVRLDRVEAALQAETPLTCGSATITLLA